MVHGYIDNRLRPCVRLDFDNGAHINVLIDTGFNGELFVGEDTAKRIGVLMLPYWRDVAVAGGGPSVRVLEGEVEVDWTSAGTVPGRRLLTVFVFAPEPPHRRGEPDGLLGMGLIAPDTLFIDCLNSIVRVATPAP
jgi:hypothetical protein